MRRIALVASMSGVLVAGLVVGSSAGENPTSGQGRAIGAIPIASGLNFPAGFTFAPDGRIFYGERFTGEIRIYDPSNGNDTLFFTIPGVATEGERGLLGIAVHPNYPSRPLVYAYVTRDNVQGATRNQIIRLRDVGGVGQNPRAIWTEDIAASTIHNGGRIQFGPDGMLYAFVGDAANSANAQNLDVDAGKILRMNPSGKPPPDNPFADSRVWVYGVRNSFGFNFDPLTGNLLEDENGPECNDELNFPTKGANMGWGPSETCSSPPPPPDNTNQDGPNPVLPQVWFTPTIAPVGMAFCVGCGIGSAEGSFFFGGYNDWKIRQVTLSADRMTITSVTEVYTHTTFPLSMEQGPDAAVYFSDISGIWKLIEV